jgi:hypothetical protein
MADAEKPPDATAAKAGTLSTADGLQDVWARFRAGEVVPCPVDGAPLALAVDAAIGVYRFVCTRCGVASAWFEAGPSGVRQRGQAAPPGRGGGPDE